MDSKSNPADDVPSSLTAECLIESKRRLNGPDFLWKKEECWPKRIVVAELSNEHPDVKLEGRVLMVSHQNALHPFIDHYCSWDRLKRGVACLLGFNYLASCTASRALTRKSSKRSSQWRRFLQLKEPSSPQCSRKPFFFTRGSSSRSPLHKLCPVLIDGILQVRGRLGNAQTSEEAKRLIILPKKHHVTDIIIRKYHEELAHAGRAHVLTSIRQKFWIVKGRVKVR